MRRARTITAGVMAALWISATPAVAFEETPPAPAQEAAVPVAPVPKAPTAELQTPAPAPAPATDKSGAKLFGFSLLPNLDFGLELLYSQPQAAQLEQGPPPDDDADVTVFGKIKRHF
jgi:hypothetical protein